MNPHEGSPPASPESTFAATRTGGRRMAWHAVAVLLAAIVAWLIFSAYRQPELMLDLAGMRLC
jgi:hypothetical protein